MIELVVKKINDGQKSLKFLKKYLSDAPLSFIYSIFRKKDFKVNGHWVKNDYVLKEGDVVRIYVTDQQIKDFSTPKKVEARPFPYPITYEDNNVLIVDKPSGVLVTGDKNNHGKTLVQAVLNYLYQKKEYDPEHSTFSPSPAHRLDRNTAGLVIFGKNDQSLKALEELFKERDNLVKEYAALVKGKLDKPVVINAPLYKDENKGQVYVRSIEKGGKEAITEVEPIVFNDDFSLVKCHLVTGRTHQIRVHLAHIGHPLIGDQKYGDFALNKKMEKQFQIRNQFLHSITLGFKDVPPVLKELKNKTFHSSLTDKEKRILSILFKQDKIMASEDFI